MRQELTTEKSKILVTGHIFALGGMENTARRLASLSTDYDCEVSVHIPSGANAQNVHDWFTRGGANVIVSEELAAAADRKVSMPQRVRNLSQYFKAHNPDIIYLFAPGDGLLSIESIAAYLSGVKRVVQSVHGHNDNPSIDWSQALKNRSLSLFNSRVIAPTDVILDQQRDYGVAESRLVKIPYGVPVLKNAPTYEDARKKLDLAPNTIAITALGRLVPDKGFDTLMKAVNLLPDELLVQLYIGGQGEPGVREMYENMLTDKGRKRVKFVGFVDPADYLSASDIFTLVSNHEPYGLVYLEAGLHGVPSIGANVGGVHEAILDQKTGLLVHSKNPDATAAAIVRLSKDKNMRLNMGEAAKSWAEAHTDVEMTRQHMQLFGDLLGTRINRIDSPVTQELLLAS